MRSVSPIYAKSRNAQRISGPPHGAKTRRHLRDGANIPGELDSRSGLDRCDLVRVLKSAQERGVQLSAKATIRASGLSPLNSANRILGP